MYRKRIFLAISFVMILFLLGCGELRYNQMSPEGKNYHPKRIGILPVNLGPFVEARGVIDQAMVTALTDKRWFARVVSLDTSVQQPAANPELRETVTAYLDKLGKLNYSDPELTRKIGELSQVDALLIVSLDFWNYMKDADTKIAKVGLGIRMADVETGKLVWEARHFKTERFLVMKPELADIAISLTKEMAGYMPR
jgi:hypothetical protein